MSVTRYDVNGPSSVFEDVNGSLVDFKDYAELESKCAVLAAENAALKASIPQQRNVEFDNDSMDDISLAEDVGFNDAIERMKINMSKTPSTDAFLAEVRAQGVEMFGASLLCPDLDSTIREFADELRKGVQS